MSDHLSRQDLVVPPQGSNLRFAFTAAACASAGFGLVWAGLGVRGWLRPDQAPPGASAGSMPDTPDIRAADDAPGVPSLPTDADPVALPSHAASRFDPSPAAPPDDSSPSSNDRYARRAGGFRDAPEGDETVRTAGAATSRFGTRPPDDGLDATTLLPPAGAADEVIVVAGTASSRAGLDDDRSAAASADGPPQSPPPVPDRFAPDPAPRADEPSDIGADVSPQRLPEDRGDLGIRDAAADGALDGLPDEDPEPKAALPSDDATEVGDGPVSPTPPTPAPSAAPFNPFAAAPSPPGSVPLASPPAVAPRGDAWPKAPATPASVEHDPDAPVPVDRAAAGVGRPTPGGMPYAAAPPIAALQPPAPPRRDETAPPPLPASGQGRPGAIHLEGVQTPQLAVEKRGPREIQVGKSARFEILVRNVGSAQANDVVLHDSVPAGTALVATTPPAAPAGPGHAPGDLVWLLGTLPPGGQARVGIDLMPLTEGDVGSVASVSFRADASVRSRATRPALAIAVQPPSPVLVGTDSRLTITVTNPGSGAATGVVLESLLPEGLSHRAGRELEFDVGSLAPGESRSIDLVLATTGPGAHGMRLVARADGQIEVAETVKVAVTAPTLDVAVEMPSRRYLQRPATCTISLANAGTAPASAVELVAQLPPGLKFVRANNAGYYEERTHRVLWNLEELPAAETGEVEVVLMPVALGPQKIVAAARTGAGLSDQAVHTVEVEGLAALSFEVADSEDPIEIGGVSEYVVRVTNQGTKPASGVRVVATLLGDMEPVDARGPAPHRVDNLTVAFEPLAKLAPSEEALYRVRVRGRREGDQRVQVQLTSDEQPAPITKEETTRVYADR